jgi:hypothetical protein
VPTIGFTDPLLALLPDEIPSGFLALPPDEQAWRGRYFLMVWAADFPEHFAWAAAMVQGTEATETKALVESVDDAQIAEQVRLRNEHYAALAAAAIAAEQVQPHVEHAATAAADTATPEAITAAFAAVQFDCLSDGSWKPVGCWFATQRRLQARMLPGDVDRDNWMQYWFERAQKPITPDGTQGDWRDWLRDACWRLSNGHTTMMVAVVPELTLDATYRREVLGAEAG